MKIGNGRPSAGRRRAGPDLWSRVHDLAGLVSAATADRVSAATAGVLGRPGRRRVPPDRHAVLVASAVAVLLVGVALFGLADDGTDPTGSASRRPPAGGASSQGGLPGSPGISEPPSEPPSAAAPPADGGAGPGGDDGGGGQGNDQDGQDGGGGGGNGGNGDQGGGADDGDDGGGDQDGGGGGDQGGGGEDQDDDGPITAPVDGRRAATLDVVTGGDAVLVRTVSLGDDLFRLSSPADGAQPSADVTGASVRVSPARGDDRATTVLLNSRVRWSVRTGAGIRQGVFDLAGGPVDAVSLGAVGRLQMALPRPDGTMPVRLQGRIGTARLSTPGVPTRVAVRGGAGVAVVGGQTAAGVRPGTTFSPPGYAGATDRIDVEATGSLGTLRVS